MTAPLLSAEPSSTDGDPRLLKSSEVAAELRIDQNAAIRWARDGHLTLIRTPGRFFLFREAEIKALRQALPLTDRNAQLLRPEEVAARLSLKPKTITRRANQGKIAHIRLPSGHRRYSATHVAAILDGLPYPPAAS